jgi:hypothetical protein
MYKGQRRSRQLDDLPDRRKTDSDLIPIRQYSITDKLDDQSINLLNEQYSLYVAAVGNLNRKEIGGVNFIGEDVAEGTGQLPHPAAAHKQGYRQGRRKSC